MEKAILEEVDAGPRLKGKLFRRKPPEKVKVTFYERKHSKKYLKEKKKA